MFDEEIYVLRGGDANFDDFEVLLGLYTAQKRSIDYAGLSVSTYRDDSFAV